VDVAGLSSRALEEATSAARSGSSQPSFYSESQWGRWLNGQSLPPRKAVRKLVEKLAEEEISAEHLIELWGRASTPDHSPQEPGNTLMRPRQLPIAVQHFIGRETQLEAMTRLAEQAASRGESAVIVIEGAAGVGKTTLANHFAHLVHDRFPDAQLYVNMHGFGGVSNPVTANEALRGFIDAFGVSSRSIRASADDQAGLYRSLLADKRALVVIDNAADAEQVRHLIPGGPRCLTIVTSRNRFTGLVAEGAQAIRLDPFTMTEARNLLIRRLGADRVERELPECEKLIRLCAGLPLALNVVAAHAATQPEFSLAVLSGEFRGRELDLLETGDPATTTRTVFSWSYQHLSDDAMRMFRLLGIHPGPDINVSATASLCATPVGQARKALDELTRANLLEEHLPGRFTFHDLLRAYARELAHAHESTDELAAAERRLLDHYLRTAHGAMRQLYPARRPVEMPPPQPGSVPEVFATYEQALAWFRAERRVLLAAITHAGQREFDTYCWQLAWTFVPALDRSGQLHELAKMMKVALTAAERTGDLDVLGRTNYELGFAYQRLGETTEANVYLQQSLELFSQLGDDIAIAQAHHGIALLLHQQGDYVEALKRAQEALRLRRSFDSKAAIAYSENAVGWIQGRLGNYYETLRHCQRSVELHRESGSRSGEADALDSVGFAYHRLGNHVRAISHFYRSLAIYQEIGDSTGQAASLTNLGDAQFATGQTEAARRNWEQALMMQREILHADTQPIEARLAQLD
jgi:tetratricopeptide (TPR) repeat protein